MLAFDDASTNFFPPAAAVDSIQNPGYSENYIPPVRDIGLDDHHKNKKLRRMTAATFQQKLSGSPAHAPGNYPGTNGSVTYPEGLLAGCRWFDTKRIKPQFPSGFGLSCTTFKYSIILMT